MAVTDCHVASLLAMTGKRAEEQTIILVDDRDKFKGYTTWTEGHYGKGRRHRGFVVLLFDEAGNVYLQKRKHRVFDSLWDLTAISHPYRLAKGIKSSKGNKGIGGRDESLMEAALRSLKNEMGIGKVELKDVGSFVYFAKDGEWCENEYCHVLVGKFDGRFKPNKKLVYGVRKVKLEEFLEEIKDRSAVFTPWVIHTVKVIEGTKGIEEIMGIEGQELTADLEKFRKEFGKYAKEYFAKKSKLAKKYPVLIQRFYKELEEFGQGGKLLRPYLVSIGYRVSKKIAAPRGAGLAMTTQEMGRILPVCMAYELVHSFLLIHDDIIDQADTRRDKLTVHKKFEKVGGPHYGSSMAILAGDLALIEAMELFQEGTEGQRDKGNLAQDMMLDIVRETIYGEALDVEYSYSKANIDQIWQVIDLKTAKYSFVGPLVLGVALGQFRGLNPSRTQGLTLKLEQYGLLVGRAYQLRDDLLGVFGDEKVTGKPAISDMWEGKNTVLLYKALEMSGQTQRQFISRFWGSEKATVKDLAQIKEIFEKSGALAWCEKKLEKMVGEAGKQVEEITKDEKLQQILRELADFTIDRKS